MWTWKTKATNNDKNKAYEHNVEQKKPDIQKTHTLYDSIYMKPKKKQKQKVKLNHSVYGLMLRLW